MSQKMLVTFASRTGSTEEVAAAVSKILADKDCDVDLSPVQRVKNLTPYRAVIIGSAIQNRQWLPEAIGFIQKHRNELSQKPFAMFSLCMTLAMRDGEKYRPQVSEWLHPVRNLVSPVSDGIFAGVLDINKIPALSDRLKFRLSVVFGVWSEGDHRDWQAINAWANELYPLLIQPEMKSQ